jgi:hypothetical protein
MPSHPARSPWKEPDDGIISTKARSRIAGPEEGRDPPIGVHLAPRSQMRRGST